VTTQLGTISAHDADEVLHAAHAIFEQRQWTIQGNVYQAAGNIFIPTTGKPDAHGKTLLEKWQTWQRSWSVS
jgi:hypothetical protein